MKRAAPDVPSTLLESPELDLVVDARDDELDAEEREEVFASINEGLADADAGRDRGSRDVVGGWTGRCDCAVTVGHARR